MLQEPIRNVHVYDGKIDNILIVPRYETESKEKLFKDIKDKMIPEASQMIDEFLSGGNDDCRNGYDASDMLYHLLLHGSGEDLYKNLNEQLVDMYNLGRCPQGRVVRLMSLLNAFVKE